MERKQNMIILLGFSGGGKTTTGRLLSKKLGIEDLDTDDMISRREGKSISEIFAREGEPYFRDLETALLRELNGLKREDTAVLAIGGGMPMREENRSLLQGLGKVFYLKARVETLEGRLKGDTGRPLLQTADLKNRIQGMLLAREDIYLGLADVIIETDDLTPEETVEQIVSHL